MERRFYVPPENIHGDVATIGGDQAHHLVSVLRKKPGDEIVVFDGQGTECLARIVRISHDLVVARIGERRVALRTDRPAVALYVAAPKGRRFDLIVEKATELGADSITPLITERTVVKLSGRDVAAKLDRWRRITVSAAKQCHRSTLPNVSSPVDFPSAMREMPESAFSIMPWPSDDSPPIHDALLSLASSHKEVRVYIGPEGGFSPEELETAKKAGVRPASLGQNILRTETAAIASLSVIGCFLDAQLRRFTPNPERQP